MLSRLRKVSLYFARFTRIGYDLANYFGVVPGNNVWYRVSHLQYPCSNLLVLAEIECSTRNHGYFFDRWCEFFDNFLRIVNFQGIAVWIVKIQRPATEVTILPLFDKENLDAIFF